MILICNAIKYLHSSKSAVCSTGSMPLCLWNWEETERGLVIPADAEIVEDSSQLREHHKSSWIGPQQNNYMKQPFRPQVENRKEEFLS